jgi:hypothetical protein
MKIEDWLLRQIDSYNHHPAATLKDMLDTYNQIVSAYLANTTREMNLAKLKNCLDSHSAFLNAIEDNQDNLYVAIIQLPFYCCKSGEQIRLLEPVLLYDWGGNRNLIATGKIEFDENYLCLTFNGEDENGNNYSLSHCDLLKAIFEKVSQNT